ncbi:hypothetical protein SAMN05444483_10281 [Salegentibacter echinorum]|uniref:Uncharacterized protein n=1 Tax=Salegentibacter echinorum TaxID=1073325 RepID=A0A1M5DRC6_SALEC|nr:hypothetical protein [Salegentibacter echinorum]SHF69568.1 hypothetical protein SAMN05444483_10281 [Salegentibacter echinorum]
MKKIKQVVTLIRDILVICSLPVLLTYAYTIHKEQIESKDATIELLKLRNDQLENSQIEKAYDRINSLKNFYNDELNIVESDLIENQKVNDSLSEILNSNFRVTDSSHLIIDLEMGKRILKDLYRGDRDSVLVERKDSIIFLLEKINNSYAKSLNASKMQIQLLEENYILLKERYRNSGK